MGLRIEQSSAWFSHGYVKNTNGYKTEIIASDIGFSNGGHFSLWLAAAGQVQAGVSYYGALSGAGADRTLSRFRQVFTPASAPVLILHSTNDSTVPVLKAIELDAILAATQALHEFQQYAGAEHRFDRDRSDSNDAAAADAWLRTQTFLNQLKKG